MPKSTPKHPGPTIGLAPGWFDLREKNGFRTDAQVAVAMGVNPITVYRVQSGAASPGPTFIASALTAFKLTEKDFGKLFRVVAPAKVAA